MTNATDKRHHEIADWLVALESHVEDAMDAQLNMVAADEFTTAVQHLHDTVRDSKQWAVAFQAACGSEPGDSIVKAGSNLLGKAAGAIDRMRHDTISKALRDDDTACNHLAIAFTMLYTTAMDLGDTAATRFAEEGLRTYAGLVQEINHLVPQMVLYDLMWGDHAPVVAPDVVEQCRVTIDRIWQATAS
jgi:ferritin-like metal-binding protein YciE